MTTKTFPNKKRHNTILFYNNYNQVRKVNYAADIIMEKEFWKKKTLYELTPEEWEALCDHCGKCCLVKQNFFGRTIFTNFHCKHLNLVNCQCKIYDQRLQQNDCLKVDLSLVSNQPNLLPETCAYKLLYLKKELPQWHPLISGTYQSVKDSQNAVSCLGPISEEFSAFVKPQILEVEEPKK